METYEKRLEKEEWGELYNKEQLEQVINSIMTDQVFCWTEELLKISSEGIACVKWDVALGKVFAYLQKHGRNVTALDFSKECVELVDMVNRKMDLGMRVVCADATKPLPFEEKEFDYIYQCGLLEHFHTEERIALLKNWGRYTKHMISMIPNAASIAYRTGKKMMEQQGVWSYGLELPQYSLGSEFEQAGIHNVRSIQLV